MGRVGSGGRRGRLGRDRDFTDRRQFRNDALNEVFGREFCLQLALDSLGNDGAVLIRADADCFQSGPGLRADLAIEIARLLSQPDQPRLDVAGFRVAAELVDLLPGETMALAAIAVYGLAKLSPSLDW